MSQNLPKCRDLSYPANAKRENEPTAGEKSSRRKIGRTKPNSHVSPRPAETYAAGKANLCDTGNNPWRGHFALVLFIEKRARGARATSCPRSMAWDSVLFSLRMNPM